MVSMRAGLCAPLLAAILATAFNAVTTGPVQAQIPTQSPAQPQTQTQSWPARPIRLVVPFPPGASNDVLSRITAQAMSPGLGQQILVENRPGGGGIVGTEAVARSPGDGYSMLNIQASFVANAALRPRLPYEPIADFAYVGMMARGPLLMVVHPSLPVKNVREFLALAKSKPGQVNYGSTGTGSHNHMATELFKRMAGINIIHVPYKGGGTGTDRPDGRSHPAGDDQPALGDDPGSGRTHESAGRGQ
jgi:tripartite-type tricarboxylate transporter receptor subunit TctC